MPITEAAPERRTAKAEAIEFLQAVLTGDPVPATEVSRMAREHGLPPKALRSAREALGVKIARVWSLPRGHIDAQPILSEEARTKTKDGYEIAGLIDKPCDYCGGRAGPPGPQSGPVYLVRNPFKGGKFAGTIIPDAEPLHEDCAAYWFDWLRKTGHGKV
jgi:hypothetical protein